MSVNSLTLAALPKSVLARVIGFAAAGNESGEDSSHDLETRLREIGFAEGDMVEALHFGLFGRNPMSVRLNGATIAMRKNEARAILVEVQNG